MNIVAIDCAHLAGEADFPMLDLPKFGWLQYPEVEEGQIADFCWRSDIIITVSTPIDQEVIDQAFKLKLIAVAGESYDHINLEAARARGIKVCNVSGADPDNAGDTPRICSEVIENISAFLNGQERNLVGDYK
jgi:hypothetical protein